jgi:hypothetical protein
MPDGQEHESNKQKRRRNRLSFPKHLNTQIIEDVFFSGGVSASLLLVALVCDPHSFYI